MIGCTMYIMSILGSSRIIIAQIEVPRLILVKLVNLWLKVTAVVTDSSWRYLCNSLEVCVSPDLQI